MSKQTEILGGTWSHALQPNEASTALNWAQGLRLVWAYGLCGQMKHHGAPWGSGSGCGMSVCFSKLSEAMGLHRARGLSVVWLPGFLQPNEPRGTTSNSGTLICQCESKNSGSGCGLVAWFCIAKSNPWGSIGLGIWVWFERRRCVANKTPIGCNNTQGLVPSGCKFCEGRSRHCR